MRCFGLTSCSWLLLFTAGCGGNVILDTASGGAHGGGGAVGVGGGAVGVGVGGAVGASGAGGGWFAGAGGAGGAVGFGGSTNVAVSASSVTSASSSGVGGSGASCGGGTYFQLVVTDSAGNDMAVSLTSSCTSWNASVPFPFARLTEGGPAGNPGQFALEGCASSAVGSQGIAMRFPGVTTVGTYSLDNKNGGMTYTDASGFTHEEDLGTLVISDFQLPGGLVVGTLDANANGPGNAVPLQAKFAVCRLPDVDVP